MGDLTEHFSLWEYRCRCGECMGGVPDMRLALALQDFRHLVRAPVYINSGCRCWRHNLAVGGSVNSRHLIEKPGMLELRKADAADVTVAGLSPRQVFNAAREIPEFRKGGIGYYPARGFCHLDTRGKRARWAQLELGGPMVAIPGSVYERWER